MSNILNVYGFKGVAIVFSINDFAGLYTAYLINDNLVHQRVG